MLTNSYLPPFVIIGRRLGNIQLYAYNIYIVIAANNIGEPKQEEAVMLGRMG
jgi:hypothetical protein